jgi:hypothetical protein
VGNDVRLVWAEIKRDYSILLLPLLITSPKSGTLDKNLQSPFSSTLEPFAAFDAQIELGQKATLIVGKQHFGGHKKTPLQFRQVRLSVGSR